MTQNHTSQAILREIEKIPVIDTHEHMLPPSMHPAMRYSFFNLMIPYAQFDLVSAGMSRKFMWRNDLNDEEVEECYAEFRNYWPRVKHNAYGMHVRRTLRESFGIDDITDDNYLHIGELLNSTCTDSHYREILQEECNIKYILNQFGSYYDYPEQDSYFIPHANMLKNGVIDDIRELKESKASPTLDDHLELLFTRMSEGKQAGARLVKYDASCFLCKGDRALAESQFNALLRGERCNSEEMQSYLYKATLRNAKELDLVAAVHTGVWDNINRKSPLLLFPIVESNPDVTFDIYHMGMPFASETAFLGKNFQNCYLDLCWSHIVSPRMLIRAFDEWLDLVPYNKIFAFGGDHATLPINVRSHLNQAKEDLSICFAKRVDDGWISTVDAIEAIKRFFYDNPKEVYKL